MTNHYRIEKILKSEECASKLSSITDLVFVSGAFDILHFGHIDFLRKAKAISSQSKLFVVTHSDKIINRIKGEGRPYFSEFERVELISELECVDYVTVWDGWENIVDFATFVKPKYFAITSKSYEHSTRGNWDALSWEQVAKKTHSIIVKIEIDTTRSSSLVAKRLPIE